MAEWYYNADCADKSTLVYFMMDDGVGAGVVQNGIVFDGHKGYAGEIGHMSIDVNGPRCQCGNYGCLELYCSAIEFVKEAQRGLAAHPQSSLNHLYNFDELDVFSAAKAGDSYAAELVERTGFCLGCGIINIIYAYSPSCVVLGGRMIGGGSLMMNSIMKTVRERINPEILQGVQIVYSRLRNDPVFTGTATVAANQLLLNLSDYCDEEEEEP